MRSLFKLVACLVMCVTIAWGQGQAVPTGFVTPYSIAAMSPSGAFAYINTDLTGSVITTPTPGTFFQIGGFVAPFAPVAQDSNGVWHYLQVDGTGALKTSGGGGGSGTVSNCGSTNTVAVFVASGTTVGCNAALTFNGTTLTSTGTGGLVLSGAGASILLSGTGTTSYQDVEGSDPSGVAASGIIWAGTNHRWNVNMNNTGKLVLVAAPTAGITAGVIPLMAASTFDLAASLLSDNATTLSYTGTGGVNAVKFGAAGATAGLLFCTQGTAPSAPANSAGLGCPTSITTSYFWTLPAAQAGANSTLIVSSGGVVSYGSLTNPANTVFATSTGALTNGHLASIANVSGDYGDSGITATNVVQIGQTNVYTSGLQDFTSATMEIPEAAGFTATVNSTIGLDITANIVHFWTNNADSLAMVTTGTSTTTTNAVFATAVAGIYGARAIVDGDLPNRPLNHIISPTGAVATFADGNNTITFSSVQTSNSQAAMNFIEATAATGGSGNSEVAITTLANSTSTPLLITEGAISTVFPTAMVSLVQGANTGATNVPILIGSATWNNASIAGPLIQFTLTNTASTATAVYLSLLGGAGGATTEFSVSAGGVVTAAAAYKSATGVFETASGTATTNFCGGLCTNNTNATQGGVLVQGSDASNTGASTVAGPATVRGGDLTGAATNLPGADIIVRGGLGTGNSTPSHVKLQSPSISGTSGTTAQTTVTNYIVHKKLGSLSSGTPTNMFNIPVAVNQTIGAEIIVHVETTQATPHNCSTTETFVASVQNTASTITQQSTGGTIGTICDTGSLTLAVAFSAATPSVFSVTPSWATIVPTVVIITVEVHNLSQQDITTL